MVDGDRTPRRRPRHDAGVDLGVPQTQAIRSDDDVVRVRQLVRTVAVAAKLSLVDQTKLVTAASELARNTLVYGGGGSAEVAVVNNGRRRGVRIVFADSGPGIPDLDLALTDGYTSGGGLGLGLSGPAASSTSSRSRPPSARAPGSRSSSGPDERRRWSPTTDSGSGWRASSAAQRRPAGGRARSACSWSWASAASPTWPSSPPS